MNNILFYRVNINQKMNVIQKKNKDNFFIFFLIFYPLLIFIFNNLDELFHFSKLFYLGAFGLILPVAFFCFVLLKTNYNFVFKFNLSLLISFLWFFQFYFIDIRSVFSDLNNKIDGYIALIIILLLSALTTFLFKYNFLKKFVLFFLIISLFISFISNFNFFSVINENKIPDERYKEVTINNNTNNPNIYYIILDGLTSNKFLKKKFYFDIDIFSETLKKQGFIIAENARASYNITHLTFASIFYADYFLDENSEKYYDRSYFYPSIYSFEKKPPLITYLDKKNYKFILFSAAWAKCKSNYKINCFFPDGNIISRILDDYAFFTFIFNSMVRSIAVKLNIKFLDQNDTIKVLKEKLNTDFEIWEDQPVFTFVHAYMPHEPYRYENCTINDNANKANFQYSLEDEINFYISSVKCTFSRIDEITELILSKDKDAIIIFQGDHGTSMFNPILDLGDISDESIEERLSIFNAALLPDKCRDKFNSKIGNVGTVQLVLSCIGINIPNIELNKPRNYIGFYEESENFGKVYRVN